MCGAVLAAKDLLGDEPVLIFSSNDVVDKSAFELVRKAEGADSFLLGKKVDKYFPGGYLKVKDDFIEGIVEKPGEGNEPSDLVNLVVHLHNNPQRLVEYMEKVSSESDDLYEVALDNMIKDGVKMKAVEYDGFWQPIKYPWHIMKVWKYFMGAGNIHKSAQIADSAVVKGDVIMEEGVKIFDNAVVMGPCYLGKNVVVATGALVRESSVGAGSVVGFGTEVARSYLGENVWLHSNYIGDSVIGNNVSFGAGSLTANLRLDEKDVSSGGSDVGANKFGAVIGDNVRVGVQSSLMPGIRVGGGSFIASGIVVGQDIEANSFVRGKWELKISENKCNVAEMNRENFKNE
ncbi:hypothetical protein JKY72_06950 [Candidatus Gracilibacteria bacterium]|nr:hypothetical protein [Candidatus Gracilibacteria bacterium]